jgi:hypothetical protein
VDLGEGLHAELEEQKQVVPLRGCRVVESPALEVAVVPMFDPRLMFLVSARRKHIRQRNVVDSQGNKLLGQRQPSLERLHKCQADRHLGFVRGTRKAAPCPITISFAAKAGRGDIFDGF